MITHDKTGQLPARWWLPERTITFHGRIDNQLDPYKNHAPIQPHPKFISSDKYFFAMHLAIRFSSASSRPHEVRKVNKDGFYIDHPKE